MKESDELPKRRRRAKLASAKTSKRAPNYKQLRHGFAPQELFSEDEIAAIHHHALRVLSELGIQILLPEAREILQKAGAQCQGDMVRIGADLVEQALKTAPRSIALRTLSGRCDQLYEPGAMIFAPGGGCPNVSDLVNGRRAGDLNAFEDAIRLCQSFDVIHILGPCIEPQDIPLAYRHFEMMRTQLCESDKIVSVFARGRAQVMDSFEMICLAHDISWETFVQAPRATTVINSNSPRMLDKPMAQGIIDFARAGQLSIITPFCLAGAMAPITIAGALCLQHAESLAGIVLAQMTKSGAPVSYGGFSSNVDMRSGAPAFGTPEHIKLQLGAGQLARYINMPWRSAAGAASNAADAQGAGETIMALWGALQANATCVLHAAGWLEGGLSFGFEKFIQDIENLQIMAELSQKPSATPEEIGFEAIADVAPSGHFFATAHTMARYEHAFYEPFVSDLSNYGTWQADGALEASARATTLWQDKLAHFTPPPHSQDAAQRLAPFIEARRNQGGALPLD